MRQSGLDIQDEEGELFLSRYCMSLFLAWNMDTVLLPLRVRP